MWISVVSVVKRLFLNLICANSQPVLMSPNISHEIIFWGFTLWCLVYRPFKLFIFLKVFNFLMSKVADFSCLVFKIGVVGLEQVLLLRVDWHSISLLLLRSKVWLNTRPVIFDRHLSISFTLMVCIVLIYIRWLNFKRIKFWLICYFERVCLSCSLIWCCESGNFTLACIASWCMVYITFSMSIRILWMRRKGSFTISRLYSRQITRLFLISDSKTAGRLYFWLSDVLLTFIGWLFHCLWSLPRIDHLWSKFFLIGALLVLCVSWSLSLLNGVRLYRLGYGLIFCRIFLL